MVVSGNHGAAARQHHGQLRRRNQRGSACWLKKQMYVGCVQQIVETLERLERKQGDIASARNQRFKRGTKGSIATEQEVHHRIVFEGRGEGCKELETLLGSHVAG